MSDIINTVPNQTETKEENLAKQREISAAIQAHNGEIARLEQEQWDLKNQYNQLTGKSGVRTWWS